MTIFSMFLHVSFFSAGFFLCQYLSVLSYCLCFGVEGLGFDGRGTKYMFCIDPVGQRISEKGAWSDVWGKEYKIPQKP